MDKPFLSAYSRLLIKTCHKRGAFAMERYGGVLSRAKIPNDNRQVLSKVTADKELGGKQRSRWDLDRPPGPGGYRHGGV